MKNGTQNDSFFQNIQKGSILEYKMTIESPYFSNIGDWYFQEDLPKLYSEFRAEIPGNFTYNRSLYGQQKLFLEDASIKRKCFYLPGSSTSADCEVILYAMKDVPAFEEESYMLAGKNYQSRISFELREFTDSRGIKDTYSKKWSDVDTEIRHEKDIGRQLKNVSYFENQLPPSLLTIPDDLERAKALYRFIQQRYVYNGNTTVFSKIRVKDAFEKKVGGVSEINLSLINALQAAKLDAKLMMLSTRKNGLPTMRYPVLTDFNYILAFLTIGDTNYLLDATNKNMPFGIIPFETLNVQGRVMDFKKGSYWQPIEPYKKNIHHVSSQIIAGEDGVFSGKVSEVNTGYLGLEKRNDIDNLSESKYIATKKAAFTNVQIKKLKIENRDNPSEVIKESYLIELEPETIDDNIYLYPFFVEHYFEENPFKEATRKYPMDFGYPVRNNYILNADLNGQYEVALLPKNITYKLSNGQGECSVAYGAENGKITARLTFNLSEYSFSPDSYDGLKTLFENLIKIQLQEPIVLKRI